MKDQGRTTRDSGRPGAEKLAEGVWEEATRLETILVVESDPYLRAALSESLSAVGYRVATAATGRDAVEAVSEAAPDLVLLDLSMPDLPGAEAARAIRRVSPPRRIPIVALTGDSRPFPGSEWMDEVLVLPVDLGRVIDTLQTLLEPARLGPAARVRPARGPGAATESGAPSVTAESIHLGTRFPARARFENLAANQAEIRRFRKALTARGVGVRIDYEEPDVVLWYEPTVEDALSVGYNQAAPDELWFALIEAFPDLAWQAEALRRRIRALEEEFRLKQRRAS